ncbi:MAG: hypothetical protein LBC04_00425 [Holosporaceae bacterium]|nr:hypothetical protein [Holosporaceae bacterium]
MHSRDDHITIAMACDENYARYTAEVISTIKASTPHSKNIIIFGDGLLSASCEKLESMSDGETIIFIIDINTLPLNREAMAQFTTKWNNLIFLKLQFPEIFASLNAQPDFVARLFGKTAISSVLWLDSDVWCFDDLSRIFEHQVDGALPVLSADLNQATNERLLALRSNSPVPPAVSAGVLLFNLKDSRLQWTAEHNLFLQWAWRSWRTTQRELSEATAALAKSFLCGEGADAKVAFLENFTKEMRENNASLTMGIIEGCCSAESIALLRGIAFPKDLLTWYRTFEDTLGLPGSQILDLDSVLSGPEWLLSNREDVKRYLTLGNEDFKKAQFVAGLDESALGILASITLPFRFNLNPKTIFFTLSPENDYSYEWLSVGNFTEMAQEIGKYDPRFFSMIAEEFRNLVVLHFDGAIKPWSQEFAALAGIDHHVARLHSFYHRIITVSTPFGSLPESIRPITLADMMQFRGELAEMAAENDREINMRAMRLEGLK